MTVEFQVFPTNTVAKEKGETENFDCKVTGVPIPQIAWKKDGELLMNDSKHAITTDILVEKNTVTSRLLIKDLSEEDIGIYYCISWNRGGIRLTEARLLLPGKYLMVVLAKCIICDHCMYQKDRMYTINLHNSPSLKVQGLRN